MRAFTGLKTVRLLAGERRGRKYAVWVYAKALDRHARGACKAKQYGGDANLFFWAVLFLERRGKLNAAGWFIRVENSVSFRDKRVMGQLIYIIRFLPVSDKG